MRYITSPWLIYFVTGSLFLLMFFTCFTCPSPPSSSLATTRLFYDESAFLLSCFFLFCFLDFEILTCKWGRTAFSLSDLFQLVECSPGPSMLSQMARFPLFYGWVISHGIYKYHIFFTHSFICGHLGCFQLLAIINSTAMKFEVHLSF